MTTLTADDLLALAHRTAQACRERQRITGTQRMYAARAREAAERVEELARENERLERARAGWEADAKVYAQNAELWRTRAEQMAGSDLYVAEAKLAETPRERDILADTIVRAHLAMQRTEGEPNDVATLYQMRATEAEERGARWALREQLLYCDRGPDRLAEIARDATRICADARAKGGDHG